ncbi:BspA family leucine-rich repeat surface protein [Williamsoniiplasma luminosum]|uniref:Lipoprotein n=1 Tax=Williamsoniiplasma luminosum TaxID=214888 RepID=A0A2S0NJL9_9MOLU|nr:BspA family leucine-rich repeat surface protein [Williamsoniiplasma luminosum]AVP49214.1 MAG: hypothetical protein C5T88_01285 [Williamsoniiplasma luminosum]
MKKLLTLLGSIGMVSVTSATVVACETPTPSITNIENELKQILNQKHDESWKLKDLQEKINEKYGESLISVEFIDSPTRAISSTPHEDRYNFTSNGTKYTGSITLTHSWTETVRYTEDISTTQTALQAILDSRKYESWSENELQTSLNTKYGPGEITVKRGISSRAHLDEGREDRFNFIGGGDINNEFNYTGSLSLTHHWANRTDLTVDISVITNKLQAILDHKDHKHQAWTQKDLQVAIDADNEIGKNEIKVTPVNALTRSFETDIHKNKWKFAGNGSIENDYKWKGSIVLTHEWKKKIDTTKDISEIKEDLEKIVRSKEEFWTVEALEKKVLELDPTGGIKVVEQTLSKSEEVPIKKWKFTADGSINNDYKYNGELEIYQIKDMQTYAQTIYIDADSKAVKSTNDIVPEGTKEVLHIGFGMDNEKNLMGAHKMPKTIEKVPNYISPQIKSLYKIFDGAKQFNDSNISQWNTSNVEIMENVFMDAELFNQELNDWNVSNVWDMNSMFLRAKSFNKDLNNWNTSKVKKMSNMFQGAEKFNGNISTWDTSQVNEMQNMFQGAIEFNQDLITKDNVWNTSSVTNMSRMFENARTFNADITKWNTSSVTNMSGMFKGAVSFNGNINTVGDVWNTSNVINMSEMFENARTFNADITKWNTSNVTDMSGMFKGASSFNRDINTVDDVWNTSNVTNMKNMFRDATTFNGDLSNWDTFQVETMEGMFEGATVFNRSISNWDTLNVENMTSMFRSAKAFNQDLKSWNVENVWLFDFFSLNSGLAPENLPRFQNKIRNTD